MYDKHNDYNYLKKNKYKYKYFSYLKLNYFNSYKFLQIINMKYYLLSLPPIAS